jgi:hypothetical protein
MSLLYLSRGARGAAFGLAVVLTLAGATRPAWADDPSTIDWSKGDVQDTKANCGALVFRNLPDRRVASLWVRGTTSGTCSFTADGLTFHMPPNHGATTQGTTTLYAFQRIGSDVLVTWINGY